MALSITIDDSRLDTERGQRSFYEEFLFLQCFGINARARSTGTLCSILATRANDFETAASRIYCSAASFSASESLAEKEGGLIQTAVGIAGDRGGPFTKRSG